MSLSLYDVTDWVSTLFVIIYTTSGTQIIKTKSKVKRLNDPNGLFRQTTSLLRIILKFRQQFNILLTHLSQKRSTHQIVIPLRMSKNFIIWRMTLGVRGLLTCERGPDLACLNGRTLIKNQKKNNRPLPQCIL